jgi:hypothetical protein
VLNPVEDTALVVGRNVVRWVVNSDKVDADTSVYDDGPLSVMLVVSYEGVLPEKIARALPYAALAARWSLERLVWEDFDRLGKVSFVEDGHVWIMD